MISQRCSALPLATLCPASQLPPQVRIVGDQGPANIGNAVHDYLADAARDDGEPKSIEHYAAANGVTSPEDLEQCRMLAWQGRRALYALRPFLPGTRFTEEYMEARFQGDLRLSGTIDLATLATSNEATILCDWKTGWLDVDNDAQMRGYAALLFSWYTDTKEIRAATIRLREGTWEWRTYTREEIGTWLDWLTGRLSQTEQYTVGDHCRFCPRSRECPAQTTALTHSLEVFDIFRAMQEISWDEATRAESMKTILVKARQLKTFLSDVENIIRAHVAAEGGQLGQLHLVPQERKFIDFATGAEVLQAELQSDLGACVTVSKSKSEQVVRDRAPRGQKGKAVLAFLARLEACGALRSQQIERLEIRNALPAKANASGCWIESNGHRLDDTRRVEPGDPPGLHTLDRQTIDSQPLTTEKPNGDGDTTKAIGTGSPTGGA